MRLLAVALSISILSVAGTGPVAAQAFPTKPITIVVPFPPGGIADPVARLVAVRLSETLGQPVVVRNQGGASGTIGVGAVARAEPDGYTILVNTSDFVTTPSLMPVTTYDPNKDLIPVTMLVTAPLVLSASIQSGFTSLADVIAKAKASPEKLNFASPGVGTINHLVGEWIGLTAGVPLFHVPYRGGTLAATALASGDVPLAITTFPSALALVAGGKAKIISVVAPSRPAFAKDQMTLAEAGMPEVNASLWVGMFVPANTDRAIVSQLDTEVQKILREPAIRERLSSMGTEATPLGPAAFAERIKADSASLNKVIELTGVKPENR